ncbi:hypothetical protein GIB67_043280 [Kingdonia uniflora]|uniref:EIF3j n=1 Tax=Kingdonia uniflora TaxID=39325 RepID=A0A7J7PBA8_9MAGN|nr:hypothetical protein GIB67_043280 [Kingdonia uniflora]
MSKFVGPGFLLTDFISTGTVHYLTKQFENNGGLGCTYYKKDLPKGLWEDEDADEDDVKESWEDDDEPISEPKSAPEPPAEKATKKSAPKASSKKEKIVEVQKKKLVEEADFKSTTELFSKKGDAKSVDSFIPKSESDFLEYAELISHKLRPYEKSFHYLGLLKAVMRLSMTNLKAADAKEVASSVTAIANEKLKVEKEANAGKKKTALKKKQLHVDKPDDDVVSNTYDALDDYDFM